MVPKAVIMIIALPNVNLHPLCGKNDSVFGQIVSDLKKILRCYSVIYFYNVIKRAKTGCVLNLMIDLWYDMICNMGSTV